MDADGYVNANGDLIGYNMYAYCSNNPITSIDPTGFYSWSEFWTDVGDFFLNIGDAFVKSIEAEISFGPGIEAEVMNVAAGYSNDLFIAIDDGTTAVGYVTSISAGPFEYSARHYSEIGDDHYYCSDCGQKDRYHTGIDYITCSESQHSLTTSLGPVSVDQDGNWSISASVGIHCIVGGSVSIGFNISEFIDRLFD